MKKIDIKKELKEIVKLLGAAAEKTHDLYVGDYEETDAIIISLNKAYKNTDEALALILDCIAD